MLATAAFPYPGSTALFEGQPVRIQQTIDAATVLIFGDKVTRRVPVSELSPPPEKSLLGQWLDQRTVPAPDYDRFTPAADVADDYRAWLAASGHADATPPSDYIFSRMMRDAGHVPVRGLHRAAGDSQSRTRVLYRFALRRGEYDPVSRRGAENRRDAER